MPRTFRHRCSSCPRQALKRTSHCRHHDSRTSELRGETVTVHIEGHVLDSAMLRDVVEKQIRRYGQGRA